MTNNSASRVGELVVGDIPSKFTCNSILEELIKALPDMLTVSVPGSENAGYVIASQNAPDYSEAKLWIELSGTGTPVAISYFQEGSWRKLIDVLRNPIWRNDDYLANKDQLNSEGYYLMDGFAGTVDMTPLFVQSSSSPVNYSMYAVTYIGRQSVENV